MTLHKAQSETETGQFTAIFHAILGNKGSLAPSSTCLPLHGIQKLMNSHIYGVAPLLNWSPYKDGRLASAPDTKCVY